MPADFGPRLPPAGLAGLLVVANPLDGCAPQGGGGLVPPSPEAVPAGATWIALIERSPPPEPNGDDDDDNKLSLAQQERAKERAFMGGFSENDGGDYEALSGLLGAFLGGGGRSRIRGGLGLATDEAAPSKKALRPPSGPQSPPCSFDAKVRAAAAAGAAAAIIFDDTPGQPLVIMAKAGGAPEPTIPAVFISAEGGFGEREREKGKREKKIKRKNKKAENLLSSLSLEPLPIS